MTCKHTTRRAATCCELEDLLFLCFRLIVCSHVETQRRSLPFISKVNQPHRDTGDKRCMKLLQKTQSFKFKSRWDESLKNRLHVKTFLLTLGSEIALGQTSSYKLQNTTAPSGWDAR